MKKERTPPPAVSAATLTDRDAMHLKWVRRNSAKLVRYALESYRTGGRGAFIIREEDAKPSGTAARYLTMRGAHVTEIGWPGAQTAQMVQTYDPGQQFVLVFLYRNGTASSYTMYFSSTNDLTIVATG
jgi:hypothetical protein